MKILVGWYDNGFGDYPILIAPNVISPDILGSERISEMSVGDTIEVSWADISVTMRLLSGTPQELKKQLQNLYYSEMPYKRWEYLNKEWKAGNRDIMKEEELPGWEGKMPSFEEYQELIKKQRQSMWKDTHNDEIIEEFFKNPTNPWPKEFEDSVVMGRETLMRYIKIHYCVKSLQRKEKNMTRSIHHAVFLNKCKYRI